MNRGRLPILGGAALVLAIGLLAVGLRGLPGAATATVTLNAAPAGHVEPAGTIRAAVGSDITITTWADDPAMTPALVLVSSGSAVGATPTRGSDGRYTYALRVPGDTAVEASFVRLADNVRLVPPGAGGDILSVGEDEAEVVVRAGSPVLANLAVDDILANTPDTGYPAPLIVRVRSLTPDGGRVVLATEPVPLTYALVEASIRASVPLAFGAPGPAAPPSPTAWFGPPVALADTTQMRLGAFQLDLSHTWSGDAGASGSTASDSVTTSGSLDIAADLEASLDIELKTQFGWPPVTGEVTLFETAFEERLSATATLHVQTTAALEQSITLLERGLPTFCISLACFVPEAELRLGVSASGDASLTVTGGFDQTARLGVRYERGAWSRIDANQFTPRGDADLTAPATARVFPTARLGARLYGLAGPWVETQPGFLELHADVNANPWWTLDAGVQLSGGVDIDFAGVFKESWELANVELVRATVAQADGPLIALATPAPSVAATPAALPTPAPTARTTPLPVAGCDVANAAEVGPPGERVPREVPASLRVVPHGMQAYGIQRDYGGSFEFIVAPAGWRCTLEVFGNGGSTLALSSDASSARQGMVQVEFSGGASLYAAFVVACPWYPRAGAILSPVESCPTGIPGGYRVEVISAEMKRFGGPNSASGAQYGDTVTGAVSFDAQTPWAGKLTCITAAADVDLCAPLVTSFPDLFIRP